MNFFELSADVKEDVFNLVEDVNIDLSEGSLLITVLH